jgi:uncharacterized protein
VLFLFFSSAKVEFARTKNRNTRIILLIIGIQIRFNYSFQIYKNLIYGYSTSNYWILFMIVGVFGSFMPVLPGPSISWLGLVLLYFTNAVPTNYWVLGITFLITLAISILDYIIPAKGTKKFGGSSYGIWGTNIGLIVGIFAPIPFGFIIGPFIGAFIGELLYDHKDHSRALKAATGSFIGFLTSSFIKFVFCMMYLGLYIWIVWQNQESILKVLAK